MAWLVELRGEARPPGLDAPCARLRAEEPLRSSACFTARGARPSGAYAVFSQGGKNDQHFEKGRIREDKSVFLPSGLLLTGTSAGMFRAP